MTRGRRAAAWVLLTSALGLVAEAGLATQDYRSTGGGGTSGPPGPAGAIGPAGPPGLTGTTGAPGVGVPAGGTTGQVLAKSSALDFATTWVAPGAASWGSITGTLSNQTDLQTALSTKAAASHTHAPAEITGTAVVTSDPRLSDARAPTSHTHTDADIPNTITIDLAATATALAANPTDCGATQFATAIAANGNLTCAALTDADVPNTITIALAATATALAANPTDCGANTFATAIDAGGNLSCAAPPASGPTTLVSTTLQSDAVIATYTPITGLAFTPLANTNYLIDCVIRYTSTAATTGINFAWDVPTAATIFMGGYTTTTAAGALEGFSQRADNVGTATANAVVTVENVAVLAAQLRNGANATSTSLGFTPETANSVSVVPQSVCQVRVY